MFKFRLPFCVRSERVAGLRFSLRLDRKHFAGVIEDGSRRFDFCAGPFAVAERAERRRFFSCADVAGNEISLLERNVELRFIGELERENFLLFVLVGQRRAVNARASVAPGGRALRNFHQSEESADAMLEMDHQIAFVEFAEIDLGAMTFARRSRKRLRGWTANRPNNSAAERTTRLAAGKQNPRASVPSTKSTAFNGAHHDFAETLDLAFGLEVNDDFGVVRAPFLKRSTNCARFASASTRSPSAKLSDLAILKCTAEIFRTILNPAFANLDRGARNLTVNIVKFSRLDIDREIDLDRT